MLIMPSLPVYDLPTAMSSFLPWLNVRYQNVLQSQVKALVFGIVRQKEKRSKAKGDEGTEDEEENKLLREPQSRSVVGERWGTWRQSGYPTSREWQKSRRCHILILEWNMEGQTSKLSHVGHSYLIAANARPTAKLLFSSRTGRMCCPSENLHHFALKRKKTAFFVLVVVIHLTGMGYSENGFSVSMAISVPSVRAVKEHTSYQNPFLNIWSSVYKNNRH